MKKFMKAKWQNIVMVNYEVAEEVLTPYLPYGVTLDAFEGKCYVSLVGFRFVDSKIFGIPIPIFGSFDEVNLRFYVKQKDEKETKRGVVFIGELVPYKIVSIMANALYYENYSTAKMNSTISIKDNEKHLKYTLGANEESHISVKCSTSKIEMPEGSHLQYIYEHYYGYTTKNANETLAYRVNHPVWQANEVIDYDIKYNFKDMYGAAFEFLNTQKPHSVYNAEGSEIDIDWETVTLKK